MHGKLRISLQGRETEVFKLTHYEIDTFSWWMPFDEIARRGRYITDYPASYYLIKFSSKRGNGIDALSWAWDPNLPQDFEVFSSAPF